MASRSLCAVSGVFVVLLSAVVVSPIGSETATAQVGSEGEFRTTVDARLTERMFFVAELANSISFVPTEGGFTVEAVVGYSFADDSDCSGDTYFRFSGQATRSASDPSFLDVIGTRTLDYQWRGDCATQQPVVSEGFSYRWRIEGHTVSGDFFGAFEIDGLPFEDELAGNGIEDSAVESDTASSTDTSSGNTAGQEPSDSSESPGDEVVAASEEVAEPGDDAAPGQEGPDEATGDDSGGGLDPIALAGIAAVAVAAVGMLDQRRRTRTRRITADQPADVSDGEEQDERQEESRIALELTHPAGQSPKVFANGWLFGARCMVESERGSRDVSDTVRWSGSGSFSPAVGRSSRPNFGVVRGNNTIQLSVTVDGTLIERTFAVTTVDPLEYAGIGIREAFCDADSHGCPTCAHPVRGSVHTGSATVLVQGAPAARVGDTGVHSACCGPNTFEIVGGDASVLIDGRPAAKIGSATRHCGGMGQIR